MSYNTDLQNNNTSLQEILATINNLPEAGSGGGSGGGVEWIDITSLPTTYAAPAPPGASSTTTYYLPIEDDVISIIVSGLDNSNYNREYSNVVSYSNGVWRPTLQSSDNPFIQLINISDGDSNYVKIVLYERIIQPKALLIKSYFGVRVL